MAPSEVLIDSNVYIDLMRAKRDVVNELYRWAGSRELVLCGMIRLEVLRGIKQPRARQMVSAFMDVMINVPTDNRLWVEATDLAWRLDRNGITLPAPDLLIAASAMRLGAAVMTSDSHFRNIEGLTVIDPPREWF
jgi:predicted nucleic acid-binding protein